ncbi:hypothetical protein FRB98_001668 [Tulasnella sp. 332]|nr:hypothetical protein FRB98_001668 [Tulasnella sp. 332]
MADEAPAAPRKVGTLRDRIAQFEQKPATSAPAPPPKPVAKKTWAWKEKQVEAVANPPPEVTAAVAVAESSESTPSVAAAPESTSNDTAGATAGMSAEDAKNAISQGGGLKARLAALQGSGFGALNDGAPAPPPVASKPRVWKKATIPYEAPPKPEYTSQETEEPSEEPSAATSEEPTARNEDDEDSDAAEKDPEEEERQRRANIAARMARLGGARVGMPIAFGKKPIPTPPRKESAPQAERAASPSPSRASTPEQRGSMDERPRQPVLPMQPIRPVSEDSEASTVEQPSDFDDHEDEERSPVLASSPPRARPPIPATRDWSRSPSPTPSYLIPNPKRSDSQGSSFSIPRTVYRYPSYIPSLVPNIPTGGVKVAPHLHHDPSQFPLSPVAPSSPSAVSSSADSASSYSSSNSPPPHHAPKFSSPAPRLRPMSHRHSDSALRSSMATVTTPHGYFNPAAPGLVGAASHIQGGPKAFFDPSLFNGSSEDGHGGRAASPVGYAEFGYAPAEPQQYQAQQFQIPPPPHASLREGKAGVGQKVTAASFAGHQFQAGNVNRLSRRASSSSFYPRPLERSTTLVAPPAHNRSASSSSSFRKLFGFGWLKKRRLTEPITASPTSSSSFPQQLPKPQSQSNTMASLKRNNSVASSSISPAARIKTKYQIASGMAPVVTSSRDKPTPLLPVTSSESSSDRDVVSMNSPVDETDSLSEPPAPPPKKIPPPRPSRPYSPPQTNGKSTSSSSLLTRSASSASTDSHHRKLQRPNNPNSHILRASPGSGGAPFSTRKPSFSDNASLTSGRPSAPSILSYNASGSVPAMAHSNQYSSSQLTHPSTPPSAWGSAASSQLGLTMPPPHPMYYDPTMMTPATNTTAGMTWFDVDLDINRK